jgi:hypothetical protein
MPKDDELPVMETAEPDEHDIFKETRGPSGDSHAADSAAGSVATSDGFSGPSGTSVVGAAIGAGASSADPITDSDGGTPAHEPKPPHTGSGDGSLTPDNSKRPRPVARPRPLDCDHTGRGGGIRTHDLFVPNEARYQAAPHPA